MDSIDMKWFNNGFMCGSASSKSCIHGKRLSISTLTKTNMPEQMDWLSDV